MYILFLLHCDGEIQSEYISSFKVEGGDVSLTSLLLLVEFKLRILEFFNDSLISCVEFHLRTWPCPFPSIHMPLSATEMENHENPYFQLISEALFLSWATLKHQSYVGGFSGYCVFYRTLALWNICGCQEV